MQYQIFVQSQSEENFVASVVGISSIVIANNGILLTRNRQDFEKIPGLAMQDWST
ncbi:hypothetical protein IQ226_24320 [Dolichospermum sp. LEGE 00240]|jgi:predicted nucleic acid-binding protein|uniref:hypothetical protein n=1 Tax=Dolichospermum sp. LEGE 00240 TaxID=1828603 RepID=UPI00187EC96D|nr:hypothetical protein [Dolichospermum sp. LEGE 00240]MDM3846446.1 hypothetical protein [Aphanizomenon gracile PMC638.10]MDM3850710.1 hypothetical protein [Aphanizomenon gracile PMC627.10]MDM3854768.1 hypothetical protein [Aphanizomenon gracile PMC649.10]MDM3863138.1 hypothetical protein [Aphanizomenon gracile PMC644.10]MBE9252159.1 hypothetical protein [Dolichospermum sp. LEGE 00240]